MLLYRYWWVSISLSLGLTGMLGACRPAPTSQAVPSPLARVLAKQRVLDDLRLFQRIKEAADAGLYKYRSKAQMDSAFTAARTHVQAADRLTVLDAYRLVVALTDFEGSLHNDTRLPDSVRAALHAEAGFFPYPVKLVAGRLLLNSAHAPIPPGAELVNVDGRPAGQLVRELGKYYTTDGFNQTGKTVGLAANFPEYYRLEYGARAAFRVRYTLPTRPDTLLRVLPAVTYGRYQQAFAARSSRAFDHDFFDDAPRPYTFRWVAGQPTAVLTINTFTLGEDNSPGHRRYATFLDSCFTLLHRAPAVRNLVVDVRANGGGDDDNDMLTFSYLAAAPFHENRGATVAFQRVPFRRYLSVAHDTTERAALVREIATELRTDFAPGADGRLHENARGNPVFRPQKNRFRGRIFLLISPRVASAGAMFAAMVRGNTPAVVIGEETMGGYYGHTGHGELSYTLPNTGIQTSFFWVDLRQDVPPRPSQPAGRGVLPDYEVRQSAADFRANRDPQLAFALRLASQNHGQP